MASLRRLLRDAWAMAAPYWRSEARWAARALLVVVVTLNLGIVYLNVLINQHLYRLVRERLPDAAVFSVGHRGTLRPFHARELVVQSDGNAPARLVDLIDGAAQQVG